MEETGGYDFELVNKELAADFQCSICTLLLKDAIETTCQHPFCQVCLKTWENEKKNQQHPIACPLCNSPYSPNEVRPMGTINRFVRSRLDVRCKHHKESCPWVGKIDEYNLHKNTCLFLEIECEFDGCNIKMIRKDLQEHLTQCQYRLVQCEYCEGGEAIIRLKQHYEVCPSLPIPCTNNGCDVKIKRNQLGDHVENHCQFQTVNCEFCSVGCIEKVQRGQLEEHYNLFTQRHMIMLLRDNSQMRNQLDEHEKKLALAEEKFDLSEQKEEQLSHDIAATNMRLHESEQSRDLMAKELSQLTTIISTTVKVVSTYLCQGTEEIIQQKSMFKKNLEMLDEEKYQQRKKIIEDELVGKKISIFKTEFDLQEIHRLHKRIQDKHCDDDDYFTRFKRFSDSMEADKFYPNDNELYIKVHIKEKWKRNNLDVILVGQDKLNERKSSKTCKYSTDELCIDLQYATYTDIYFYKKGWTSKNSEVYLMNPKKDEKVKKRNNIGDSLFYIDNLKTLFLYNNYVVICMQTFTI